MLLITLYLKDRYPLSVPRLDYPLETLLKAKIFSNLPALLKEERGKRYLTSIHEKFR